MRHSRGITLIWLIVVVFLVSVTLIAIGQCSKWQHQNNYWNRVATLNSILANNYPFYYLNSFDNTMSPQNWQIMDQYLDAYNTTSAVKTVFLWIEALGDRPERVHQFLELPIDDTQQRTKCGVTQVQCQGKSVSRQICRDKSDYRRKSGFHQEIRWGFN